MSGVKTGERRGNLGAREFDTRDARGGGRGKGRYSGKDHNLKGNRGNLLGLLFLSCVVPNSPAR